MEIVVREIQVFHIRGSLREVRPARVLRLACTVLTVLLMAGCGALKKQATPEENLVAWLEESPRKLAVTVELTLPEPQHLSRDPRIAARIGRGAGGGVVGAGYVFLQGCASGGPYGCLAGLILTPVGFVVGLVQGVTSVESDETQHSLEETKGAKELISMQRNGVDMPGELLNSIIVFSRDSERYTLMARPGLRTAEIPAGADALVTLSIVKFGFLGDVGDDPRLGVVISAQTAMRIRNDPRKYVWREVTYEGSKNRLSKLAEQEASLFRNELENGLRNIAQQILEHLSRPDPKRIHTEN